MLAEHHHGDGTRLAIRAPSRVVTSSEIVAEHAGNKLWIVVQEMLKER